MLAGERLRRAARDRFTAREVAEFRRSCVYHQPDWMSVARLGCALAETHGSSLTDDAMDAAAVGVDPSDRLWLRSLFEWPIKISGIRRRRR